MPDEWVGGGILSSVLHVGHVAGGEGGRGGGVAREVSGI